MILHCDREVLDNNVVMDFLQKDDLCNIPDNTTKLMAPYSKDWPGPKASDDSREQDPAELTRQDQIYLKTALELHHYWKSRMRALALTRSFKRSSLARLGMVKDDKNESTLADLVERIVRQQYPEWEVFTNDIAGVMTAQKINIEQLQTDAKKYVDNIRNVQMSLDSGNLSDPKKFHPQDRVSQVVQRCMKDARRKAEQMALFLEEMVRA